MERLFPSVGQMLAMAGCEPADNDGDQAEDKSGTDE